MSSAKQAFTKLFPERQIYHRSSGKVSYYTLTPLKQVALTATSAAVMGWMVFASATVALGGSSGLVADQREIDTYERWVEDLRARDALSRAQLAERTEAFQQATLNFERRHNTLEVMLRTLEQGGTLEASALRGESATLLVNASIDEADQRVSRVYAEASAPRLNEVGLRGQLTDIEADQERILNEVEELAVARAEEARSVLRLTAVGASRIGKMAEMGGPVVDFADLTSGRFDSPEEAAFAGRVAQVAARLEEARYYEDIVETLPLGEPVGVTFRKTSDYGMRVDPFNKSPGWHNGLDLAAYWDAPITAAGPGLVTFAGYKGGYGRIVEIDHGNGFRSRYGHMKSVAVNKGDDVAMGDTIGAMGSTGRSTGPHLHYEVWFQGKPYDPVEFLKAGRHVQQD